MNKISKFLNELTSDELEELIEKAQLKINAAKTEKQVKLIGVYRGIIVCKYFELTDKEKVIDFAHEMLNQQWIVEKDKDMFDCNISIDTCLVPASEVNNYLKIKNDK